jgi:hypothetical protein
VRGRSRIVVALTALAALTACVPPRHVPEPPPPPTAASEWPSAYVAMMEAAHVGRLDSADHALTAFAQRFPGTAETREVPYWRALLKLDSTNVAGHREAVALLQEYLADTTSALHRTEAATLLRLQRALDARAAALAAQPPAAAVRTDDKARDDEVQRLRDDLAHANAELERIKRRLARPKP